MSSSGRGRGYTGRHSRARPGAPPEEPRPAEISPRAQAPPVSSSPPGPAEEMSGRASRSVSETDLLDNISAEDDAVLKDLLHIDEQFQPLLVLLEQFSPSEDGIQFNRKLRNFETTITNMCPDETRLQAAFATFRAAALRSSVTARKLAGVGASFTRQQRQQLLRTTLLNVIMQGTFSKLDILERANPLFLINAANLMGDYFSEARLCNGNKVHILAGPLLHYMRALLAQDDVRAHRTLATQLMQNGRELLGAVQAEAEELGLHVRLRLLSPPPCGVVWLLLAADMALNKFLPLPTCLQQFYAQHLQLQPAADYSEVRYGSWRRGDAVCPRAPHHDDDDDKPKLRPILGAGAGLVNKQSQETYDWTKSNLSKRYDLNSWRQEGDEEPLFDPSVLPPPVPPPQARHYEHPPPAFNYNNYLQQGDGHYIQNQYYKEEPDLTELGLGDGPPHRDYDGPPHREYDGPPHREYDEIPERATMADFEKDRVPDNDKVTDKVNNEIQKCSRTTKPLENWRRDQEEEDSGTSASRARQTRSPARRHVSDVPRNHKYWDHDDRCDKDY